MTLPHKGASPYVQTPDVTEWCACRFHDICLNHSSLEWQYYVDPEDAEVPLFYHYLNGHAVYEFPGDFVMTGHVHILPYTPWAPKVCASWLFTCSECIIFIQIRLPRSQPLFYVMQGLACKDWPSNAMSRLQQETRKLGAVEFLCNAVPN